MGDEQQGALIGLQGLFELLDGLQVQVVGGLVEHQDVHPAGLEQGQGCPGALAGRELVHGAVHVVGPEAELGQQGAHLPGGHLGHERLDGRGERDGPDQQRARLVDLPDLHAGPQGGHALVRGLAAQQPAQQGGLAGPVGPGDADPLPRVHLEGHRAEREAALPEHGVVEGGDHRAGARRRTDGELQPPLLARLLHLLQARDAALHLPDLLGLLLARLTVGLAAQLVVVRGLLHRVAHALAGPLPLGAGAGDEVLLLLGELLVLLPGLAAQGGPLLEVGLVAAAVDAVGALGEVELQDAGDAAGQELAVVAHQHDAAAQLLHEGLQAGQAVEVEVVGGLVQEHDVEAGEQQRGEADAGGLPTGEGGHEDLFRGGGEVQAEVGQDGGDALLQVRGAGGQPAGEGGVVAVRGGVGDVRVRQGLGGLVHLGLRGGAPGAAGDVPGDRLPRHPLVLLRQPADEGVRGGEGHGAGLRGQVPAEDAQQRGLARAVGPHDADDVPGRDREVQILEERAVAVAAGEAGGDKGGGHGAPDGSAAGVRPFCRD